MSNPDLPGPYWQEQDDAGYGSRLAHRRRSVATRGNRRGTTELASGAMTVARAAASATAARAAIELAASQTASRQPAVRGGAGGGAGAAAAGEAAWPDVRGWTFRSGPRSARTGIRPGLSEALAGLAGRRTVTVATGPAGSARPLTTSAAGWVCEAGPQLAGMQPRAGRGRLLGRAGRAPSGSAARDTRSRLRATTGPGPAQGCARNGFSTRRRTVPATTAR